MYPAKHVLSEAEGTQKAAKKIPLSSPFGKGGKRGILLKWRPADAVQDMLDARIILSISI
jgi:hypothetical protein